MAMAIEFVWASGEKTMVTAHWSDWRDAYGAPSALFVASATCGCVVVRGRLWPCSRHGFVVDHRLVSFDVS